MALRKQELWNQLRDADAASPQPGLLRRRRSWLIRGPKALAFRRKVLAWTGPHP